MHNEHSIPESKSQCFCHDPPKQLCALPVLQAHPYSQAFGASGRQRGLKAVFQGEGVAEGAQLTQSSDLGGALKLNHEAGKINPKMNFKNRSEK